jgi:small subunit ribosomal protein S17
VREVVESLVPYLEKHPKYGKYIRRHIRFRVHDEKGEAREGDVVRIAQTRPLSATKRWRLVQVITRAKG